MMGGEISGLGRRDANRTVRAVPPERGGAKRVWLRDFG